MVSGNRNRLSVSGFPIAVLLLAAGLVFDPVANAQDQPAKDGPAAPVAPKKPAIEVFRGGVRTDARGNRLVSPLDIRRANDRVKLARQRADRQMAVLSQVSEGLADQSFDSFSRGLMPLPDHLEQVALTQRAELLTARDEKQAIEIQIRHIERLDAVVEALRNFNQPNAQGWQADLLLAQTLAAEARSQLATLQKRDGAAAAARELALELAETHLQQRRADSTIGWATVPMMVNARLVVQRIQQNEPYTLLPAEEFLDDAVALTRSWQERDAGVGRADRIALAEYQQARFALRHGLELDRNQIAQLYQTTERAAIQLYDQQREFFRTGTASLYDVAQAWNFREELGAILSLADLSPPQASEQQMMRDLGALQAFAEGVEDRRGRIEADLSYISVLGTRQQTLRVLDDLDSAEAELKKLQEASAATEKAATSETDSAAPASDAPATAPRKPRR